MKSQATRTSAQPEADADTISARRHYSDFVSAVVASTIIVAGAIVMAYAALGLAMRPG